ncbi:hypothetical protein FRC03_010400 [Tulasnella sp. 419]|nr:hypothetical protein FRC03_010400 [Tulasnella sp. 419]
MPPRKGQPQSSSSLTLSVPMSEHVDPLALKAVADMPIIDSRGNTIPFGRIYEYQRTVVVFIRNFLCGMCHNYVSLLAQIPDEALDAAGTKIVIICCGDWRQIPKYRESTAFRGLVYADPKCNIYNALGMIKDLVVPPKSEPRRSYVPNNYRAAVMKGITEGLKQPVASLTGKAGNWAQLGGDFILGPGDVCDYAHRMRHTMDHIEISDLMRIADIRYS